MVDEINHDTGQAGQNVYFRIWSAVNTIYRSSVPGLVPYISTDWAAYALTMADVGGGTYLASMPGGLPAGIYNLEAFIRLGGSPASTDTRSGKTTTPMSWDGAAEVAPASAITPRTIDQDYQGTDSLLVRDANQNPLAGATVTAHGASAFASLGPDAPAIDSDTTDAQGHWTMDLVPGEYVIVFAFGDEANEAAISVH